MATRRRGGSDLSDLKAKLGIQEAPEPEPQPEAQPEAAEAQAAEEGGESAGDASHVQPAYQQPAYDEDYATATSTTEDESIKIADVPDDTDYGAVASSNNKAGGIVFFILAGVVVGIIAALALSAMRGNKAIKTQIAQAEQFVEEVQPLSQRITVLKNDLEAMTFEGYSAEFQERLLQDFGPSERLGFAPNRLSNYRALLASESAAGDIVPFVVNLQALGAQIDRHIELTNRDQREINSIIEGTQDETNYAVVYNVQAVQGAYQEYVDNPEESNFTPTSGLRVALPDTLEIVERNDDFFYEIAMPDGNTGTFPIYAVISLPREQLIEGMSPDNAMSRYNRRVESIRSAVSEIATQASGVLTTIEDVAAQ